MGLIEFGLGLRVFLKLVGANARSGFASFIYAVSNPLALPFRGVMGSSASDNYVMEWSTRLAMAVYFILAWLLTQFFQVVKPVNQQEVEEVVDHQT